MSLIKTVAVCNLSVTAVSLVARATVNDSVFSTIVSLRMGIVTT